MGDPKDERLSDAEWESEMGEAENHLISDAELWESGKFAVVRAVVSDGNFSIVFTDQNSDYSLIGMTAYRREGPGWREIDDWGDASYLDVGEEHSGRWSASEQSEYGWTLDESVQVRWSTLSLRASPSKLRSTLLAGGCVSARLHETVTCRSKLASLPEMSARRVDRGTVLSCR